jgi:hypothetical protein
VIVIVREQRTSTSPMYFQSRDTNNLKFLSSIFFVVNLIPINFKNEGYIYYINWKPFWSILHVSSTSLKSLMNCVPSKEFSVKYLFAQISIVVLHVCATGRLTVSLSMTLTWILFTHGIESCP